MSQTDVTENSVRDCRLIIRVPCTIVSSPWVYIPMFHRVLGKSTAHRTKLLPDTSHNFHSHISFEVFVVLHTARLSHSFNKVTLYMNADTQQEISCVWIGCQSRSDDVRILNTIIVSYTSSPSSLESKAALYHQVPMERFFPVPSTTERTRNNLDGTWAKIGQRK